MGGEEEPVRLAIEEARYGEAQELPAQERARLAIAGWVLGVVALIFILSAFVLVYGPNDRLDEQKMVFEFVKTIAPPIVTLVIGFYFRGDGQ